MTTVNLVTKYGDLDVALEAAGVDGFAGWDTDAAGRAKDRIQLPQLRALRDRLRRPQN